MRFRLRTLLVLLAVGPVMLAVGYRALIPPKRQATKSPIIYAAKYIGNRTISDKKLNKILGIRGRADGGIALSPTFANEGRRKIEQCYLHEGLPRPTVTLLEGGQPGDSTLSFQIREKGDRKP